MSTTPTHHTEGSRSAAKPTPARSTKAIADLIVTRKPFMSSAPKENGTPSS